MSASVKPLPNFENPPVVEVALSVQFKPLVGLKVAHLGRLWSTYRDDGFTQTEDHRNLDSLQEAFDHRHYVHDMGIRFRSLDTPPVPRVWFLNEPGTELIQVQQDRVIHNWRKTDDGVDYVRYPNVRQRFVDSFAKFGAFAHAENLGDVEPNQCEITYTNHLVSGEGWSSQGDMDQVFSFWSQPPSDFLQGPENVSVTVRYLIPDEHGKPIGRLYVDIQPAFRNLDFRPMLILNLTARGAPLAGDSDGILGFFDLGREWIVRGFAEITTNKMHAIWRRIDVS